MKLTRKARYMAGDNLTDPPSSTTYTSVVISGIVCPAFLIAALNDLDMLAGDIQKSHLNDPTKYQLFSMLVANVSLPKERLLLLFELSMV